MFKRNGFSLIELMMVVIIIGILVTIAIPNYSRSVERAKCAQAMGTLKSLRNAMGSWYVSTGEYTGADEATLGNEVHATFEDNADWTYSFTVGVSDYTLTATRVKGPHIGLTIEVTELGDFSSSSYPYDDAGNW